MGIDWGSIDLEDHWSAGQDDKWNYVSNHLTKARIMIGTGSPRVFITFSSFTSGAEAPGALARSMNPKLHNYVTKNDGKLGIIASDYPGPKLIGDTIAHN